MYFDFPQSAIAEAWITKSYQMVKLDLKAGKIRFKRKKEGVLHIQVPKWLTEEKIPENAIFELENYFDYIKRKYGL